MLEGKGMRWHMFLARYAREVDSFHYWLKLEETLQWLKT